MSRSESLKPEDRAQLREQLVRAILGTDVELTSEQVAEKSQTDLDAGRRLWRALGFPEVGDAVAFAEIDVEALVLARQAVSTGLLDDETVYRMTRALGRTMSRLADWQVEALVEQIERDVTTHRAESRLERAVELASLAAPGFEELMLYAWRRHLAAAAARIEALGALDEELLTTSVTVGFVDLSRFTSLTNDLDDSALGHLVEDFEDECTDVVTDGGGRVIKSLGDAVLFVSDDAAKAARIGLDLVADMARRSDIPDVKVGLATGSVLSRMGDVFGPPVNLAARLTTVARSNRVLVDEHTASLLGDEFEQRVLPERQLRGFGLVSPITISERRSFRAR